MAKPLDRVPVTLNDLQIAEELLIRAIQSRYFHKEIKTLLRLGVSEPNSIHELKEKSSGLLSLSPFLDEKGIMRVGGRLGKSKTIPYDHKYPIIMPDSDAEETQSLVRHYHTKDFHASSSTTFYTLRQKFYLVGGRNSVNKIVSKCVECQKASKKAKNQKMDDLPSERVTIAAPFANTGLDVFGDFTVKHAGRGEKKRWALLATCLVTRAIAIYPLTDMTLTSVILALVKMQSQFPSLKKIFSDNGSNFKGANRELKEAMASWNQQEAADRLADHGLEWSFGPAACGSHGGVWERLIQIVKNSFKACMGNKILTVDQFDALCCGVAGVVNRRPLTRATNTTDDMFVLSPSHFIHPYIHTNSSNSVLPPDANGDMLRSSWTALREILDNFWQSWVERYLYTLQERSKWLTTSDGPKINDVVLIKEPIVPREKWKTARVIEIIGDEVNTRRYKLHDAAGNCLDRHISGIIKLELN